MSQKKVRAAKILSDERETRRGQIVIWISIGALLVSAFSAGYAVYKDRKNEKSVDARMSRLETSMRLITASIAPQLYRSLDDSLRAASDATNSGKAQPDLYEASAQIQSLNTAKYSLAASDSSIPRNARNLERVVSLQPENPQAWRVAGEFITYLSGALSQFAEPQMANCLDNQIDYTPHPPAFATRINDTVVANCKLDLSDVGAFEKSEFGKKFRAEVKLGQSDVVRLIGSNLDLYYSGGKMIPFFEVHCENCRFHFVVQTEPPAPGGRLVQNVLLAYATDPSKISVTTGSE